MLNLDAQRTCTEIISELPVTRCFNKVVSHHHKRRTCYRFWNFSPRTPCSLAGKEARDNLRQRVQRRIEEIRILKIGLIARLLVRNRL